MENTVLWVLIAIQVFMGAFDTIFHHEGTERLAWRPSQKRELRLHGVRNIFYALIFICFGWFEPKGAFAIALATILVSEVLITLWDFVEEDLTRKLPWTERINHTLLALNYGAIIALLAPTLWTWMLQPSTFHPVSYGWWSAFATVSALGVALFGMRDLLAAEHSDRLRRQSTEQLVSKLPSGQRVLVTGGTGFIGQRLTEALVKAGHEVTVLTRDLRHAHDLTHPVRIVTDLGQVQNADHFSAVINLAGDPVAGGLWTQKKRHEIIRSRVETTRKLCHLIARLDTKPDCFISGSAIGWYGLQGDARLTEEAAPAPAFIHDVCAAWEKETADVVKQGVRCIQLRIGLVLGVEGGILAKLLTPFEFGLGGAMGSGQQWMSWIERDDLVKAITHTMSDKSLHGPVNATAPEPVRNTIFTKALARALHRPALLLFPGWILKAGLGDMARETMLGGQRVIPEKLLKSRFTFQFNQIDDALKAVTGCRVKSVNKLLRSTELAT